MTPPTVELVITGSPVGKAHAADDASQNLLLVQDEDECLNTVLERHIAFYNDPAAYSSPGMMPLDAAERQTLAPIVGELAKVLVYLNLPDAELVPTRGRTDLERRLKGAGTEEGGAAQAAAGNGLRSHPGRAECRGRARQGGRQRAGRSGASALAARSLPAGALRRRSERDAHGLDQAGVGQWRECCVGSGEAQRLCGALICTQQKQAERVIAQA